MRETKNLKQNRKQWLNEREYLGCLCELLQRVRQAEKKKKRGWQKMEVEEEEKWESSFEKWWRSLLCWRWTTEAAETGDAADAVSSEWMVFSWRETVELRDDIKADLNGCVEKLLQRGNYFIPSSASDEQHYRSLSVQDVTLLAL